MLTINIFLLFATKLKNCAACLFATGKRLSQRFIISPINNILCINNTITYTSTLHIWTYTLHNLCAWFIKMKPQLFSLSVEIYFHSLPTIGPLG